MVNKEEIAEWLLQKGYFLTALEFYQELLEDDGTDLEILKEYFIKQSPNFEAESPRFRGRMAYLLTNSSIVKYLSDVEPTLCQKEILYSPIPTATHTISPKLLTK